MLMTTIMAASSQKRKLDQSVVSVKQPRKEPRETEPARLDLTETHEAEMEAEESAYQLSVSVAKEKAENAKFEEYLKTLVQSGETDSLLLGVEMALSPIAPKTTSVAGKTKTCFTQTPPESRSTETDEVRSRPVGGDLNDTLECLEDSIRSEREADKLFEMKLRAMMVDTP